MGEPPANGRPRVLVLDDYEGRMSAAPGTARMRGTADVNVVDRPLGELADEELEDVSVVVALRERTPIDSATLARLPRLELVLQTGGGANHIDVEAASRRGVAVALGRRAQVGTHAVPELTIGLMVAAVRLFPLAERARARGEWPALTGRTLHGRQLGVLGMGRIGREVARLARSLGMQVLAWDRGAKTGPVPTDQERGDGVRRVTLEDLLSTSDVVSIHLRLTDQSRGLLHAERLRSMRPGSVLVNTARGAIVEEQALVEVLTDGPLAAAALDVFSEEPLPPAHPLRALPNVVLTPHIGWTVEEAFEEFAEIAADQLEQYVGRRLVREDLLDPSVAPTAVWGGLTDR